MISGLPMRCHVPALMGLATFLGCALVGQPACATQSTPQPWEAKPQDAWLQMQPGDYGTRALLSQPDTAPVMRDFDLEPPPERLASLSPLRDPIANGNRELVQTASYSQTDPRQAINPESPPPPPWQDELDSRQPLQQNSNVDDVIKNLTAALVRIDGTAGAAKSEDLAKRLQAARDALAAIQADWNDARSLDAKTKAAPQEAAGLQQKVSQPQSLAEATLNATTAAEGQTALDAAKQTLQQFKQDFEQHQGIINGRGQTKTTLEAEIAALRKQLDESPPPPPPADESPEALLKQLETRIQLLGLRAQLLSREERLKYHEASEELTLLKRDLAQLQVAQQQSLVEEIERQVNELRRAEVQLQAKQAERDAAQLDATAPSLAAIAENNSKLVRDRDDLTRRIESTTQEKNRLSESLEKVKDNRSRLESKVAVAGMNHTVGSLMLIHRRELPNISEIARRIKETERELSEYQLTRINLEDLRNQYLDVASVVQATLDELVKRDHVTITPQIESAITELINTRKQLMKDVIHDVDQYIEELVQVDSLARELIAQTRTSQYFVDKNVLWIRSTEPLNETDIRKTVAALVAVTRSLQPEVANFDWRTATRQWSKFAIWAMLFFVIGVLTRKRLKTMLGTISEEVSRSTSRGLAVVGQMLVLMLLVAAFWPAVFWGIGQYLSNDAFDTGSAAGSLGRALLSIVPFMVLACMMRQLTLRDGFSVKYLGWSPSAIVAVDRSIRWYLYSVLPLRGAGVFFDHFQEPNWAASAGRTMFILSQITLFVCLNIAIRQVSLAILGVGPPRERSFWVRTRRVWCTVIVLAPLALAALSLVGYHYSAGELSYRFGWTMWLILGAAALVSLAHQIVQIVLQKISVRRFWLDRMNEAEHPGGEPNEDFDAEKTSHQIGRLLRGFTFAGVVLSMFLIWSQVLPAIQILDRVELWPIKTVAVENVLRSDNTPERNPDGSPMTRTVTKIQNISLADLAWAAICLGLTVILSRNLPGLLEVTLLDRLPLDRGGKYAISVVCRYLVAIVGCIFAARILGFEWSSVQWLVAAMSVGLGFGLQEIFGNFVSGMIILLERPIRVGDLVTVNGTTGCVTRIQLRATTITDADRKEMIVPNKKFITDDVVNWTLTDPITRVVIPIGIAYGSNTELACATLMQVAQQNQHVMRDPPPNVVFTRFGASSLDLELRVYIATREHFPDVQHELHLAIDHAFREKKIEIAYPQQDIHIRAADGMAKALLQARHELKQPPRNQNAA